MPLIPTTMVAGFTSIFQGPALGPVAAAQQMAKLYAAYAQLGVFGASLPVLTGLEQVLLAQTLATTFASPGPNPAAFGQAWATGLLTFWLLPPVVVAGAQAGAVTAIPGTLALPASLGALVASPFNTAPSAASTLALALHTATLTCLATVAPPPGTVVSIL
jgi:hypothetical protein